MQERCLSLILLTVLVGDQALDGRTEPREGCRDGRWMDRLGNGVDVWLGGVSGGRSAAMLEIWRGLDDDAELGRFESVAALLDK